MTAEDELFVNEFMEKVREKFETTKRYIVEFTKHCREEGPLSLRGLADARFPEIEKDCRLLYDGLELVVDGTDNELIEGWFDDVSLLTDNWVEAAYVGLVKRGILYINDGLRPETVKKLLDSGFDFNRKIL